MVIALGVEGCGVIVDRYGVSVVKMKSVEMNGVDGFTEDHILNATMCTLKNR